MTDKEAADFLKKSTLFISVPRKNTKTVTQLLYIEAMTKAIAALEEKAKVSGAHMISSDNCIENPCKTCALYVGNMCEHVCEERYDYIMKGGADMREEAEK